jgi:hypothetical protein
VENVWNIASRSCTNFGVEQLRMLLGTGKLEAGSDRLAKQSVHAGSEDHLLAIAYALRVEIHIYFFLDRIGDETLQRIIINAGAGEVCNLFYNADHYWCLVSNKDWYQHGDSSNMYNANENSDDDPNRPIDDNERDPEGGSPDPSMKTQAAMKTRTINQIVLVMKTLVTTIWWHYS